MHKTLRKAQKGDDNAFIQLFAPFENDLYRIAYIHTKNEQDALDVMQEVAYRAFKNIKSLKHPQYLKTWLTRITINCAIDHIRANSKVIQLAHEYLEESDSYSKENEMQIIQRLTLNHLMNTLSPEEKSIIILKYYQNYTFKEISEILNLPLGTVKSSLYRSLNKLRMQIKEEDIS